MTAIREQPDIVAFRAAARAREAARRAALEARRARFRHVAEAAAALLRTRFAATRVVLFGSTLRPTLFHERSDLDLAVWGLSSAAYWAALAVLEDLEPAITIDLVPVETARPGLAAVIEEQGITL